ncbi:MAG: hypothetical protein ONB49_20290, partial [candidate division KSB1 bacterium]|nr:hypothetical protein [candidate division KSB1 bacterium]
MLRTRSATFITPFLLLPALAWCALPGVKHSTVTTMKFHGFLGTVMKMAGADQPHSSTTYVQGHQYCSEDRDEKGALTRATIIDLDREVYISIDHKKKEYSEMTFAQFKEMMRKLQSQLGTPAQEGGQQPADVKVEFDVKVNRTGETKTIAGFHTEKVVLTLTATGEKAATATEQGGSGRMVVTSTMWLTRDASGHEEQMAFWRLFSEKMGMNMSDGQNMLASLQAVNPQLAKAIAKLKEESRKMQGFAVLVESKFETQAQTGTPAAGAKKAPPAGGGLLGGLGKFMKQPGSDEAGGV